ncbi:hypothetical protein Tco_1185287 [Tanacetum coccineum]
MVTQELAAKAMDNVTRQSFKEEKRRIASQKKASQATSTNKLSIDRQYVSTNRPSVSTDRPSVSTANTSTGTNAGESTFVYLGGRIPIDASTLPNADLPTDPNMPDLEDASDTLPNDRIFNGAYDDDKDMGAVADFNNMDNTIAVSPIPTLRIHKVHPKDQILGDPQTEQITKIIITVCLHVFSLKKNPRLYHKPYKMKEKMVSGESMCTEFEDCMHKRFQMSSIVDILKKFDFSSIKTTTTPIESNKPLVKDEDGVDVDVHIYRWLQFCRRLISWQCKKQTIVANSTTEAEYVAAANCCGQLLWIQNQMMDYGFNFMNTKIHIDNESTICIVKNHVYHSSTKHIEIQHHFIRDCYEKRLIDVVKIHTDNNVADLLTKGFDVTRFNFLMVSIGMLNL